MSDDVLVRVENVSKRFCRSLKRSLWYGLQDLGSELGGRRHGGGAGLPQSSPDVKLRQDEFWAVKDVSFELRRGECLGLIGRNGAGKTTLLRMLNGLIKPDTGRLKMSGKVNALIALGAGFNPLLSGRENIYINSSLLGKTRLETDKDMDEIIDFSGIAESIDSPVSTYSSGMSVRLGFSIAALSKPDILILDEVLAVGDEQFRSKCLLRIARLMEYSAVILVSHQTSQIQRSCTKAMVLEKGTVASSGDTMQCINFYKRLNQSGKTEPLALSELGESIRDVKLISFDKFTQHGDSFTITVEVTFKRFVNFEFIIGLVSQESGHLAAQASTTSPNIPQFNHKSVYVLQVNNLQLRSGRYAVNLNLIDSQSKRLAGRILNIATFNNSAPWSSTCDYQPTATCHASVSTD